MGADAMLYGAAIGSVLILILSIPVTVLCRRALRERVRFEGEIKTPWFSYRLRTETREPRDGDSGRACRWADARDSSRVGLAARSDGGTEHGLEARAPEPE
jgi:hypothetical protein